MKQPVFPSSAMQALPYPPTIGPRHIARWSEDLSVGTRAAGTTGVLSKDVNVVASSDSRTASIVTVFSACGISENATRAQGLSAGTATHRLTKLGSSISVSGRLGSAVVAATWAGASNGISSVEVGRRLLRSRQSVEAGRRQELPHYRGRPAAPPDQQRLAKPREFKIGRERGGISARTSQKLKEVRQCRLTCHPVSMMFLCQDTCHHVTLLCLQDAR